MDDSCIILILGAVTPIDNIAIKVLKTTVTISPKVKILPELSFHS